MGFFKTLQNMADGCTRTEGLVRDATGNNSRNPDAYDLRQIANSTMYQDKADEVMKALFERMNDMKVYYHVKKSLSLLQYLLIYGSPRVLWWYQQNVHSVQSLCTYHQNDSYQSESAASVRQLASEIVAFVQDQPRLTRTRNEAVGILAMENEQDMIEEEKDIRRQEARRRRRRRRRNAGMFGGGSMMNPGNPANPNNPANPASGMC